MKKSFTAIVLLVLFLFSCDEYVITPVQEESFIKFYGGGLEDEGMKVLTIDEGYLVMGNIKTQVRNQDICVIRTDKYGNSVAPIAVYGGPYNDYGYAIKPDSNGYIIVGSTVSEYSDKQVYLVQIDSKGDTLWTRNYGGSYDDEAFDVLVLDNGNLVLAGYTERSELNKDFLLIETKANGTLVKFRPQGLVVESEVLLSIARSNSDYLLAGYTYSSSELVSTIFAIIWDGSEAPPSYAWKHTIGIRSQVNAICSAGSNEYYLACTVQPNQSNNSQIYIIKIGNNLNPIWQKSYGERVLNNVSDIAIYENSILITGTSSDIAGTSVNDGFLGDMLILKTNLLGENPEYIYMGDGSSYRGQGLDRTPDGGYILTGANYVNNSNSVITLCKLTAEGTLR